ncbi:hypothetical protein [Treponema sp.]|uniref:hypothetical protein n=1 Tax=Treponema sp. TaxID=166 RepID=UPI003FD8E6AD
MKRLIIAVMCMLLDTGLFAKQYVIRGGMNFKDVSSVSAAENKCNELIEQGYHIDSVAITGSLYLIVYSDKEKENDR